MTNEEFAVVVEDVCKRLKELVDIKGKEYAQGSDDRLINFKMQAAYQCCSPERALLGCLSKQVVSVSQMCQGGEYTLERWLEKIHDSVTYLVLLRGLIEERLNVKD